jgi:hypothetical protein
MRRALIDRNIFTTPPTPCRLRVARRRLHHADVCHAVTLFASFTVAARLPASLTRCAAIQAFFTAAARTRCLPSPPWR